MTEIRKPKVTIMIPTFNQAAFVGEAIDNLLLGFIESKALYLDGMATQGPEHADGFPDLTPVFKSAATKDDGDLLLSIFLIH